MKCKAYFGKAGLMLELEGNNEALLRQYAKACAMDDATIVTFDKKKYTLYLPHMNKETYSKLCQVAEGEKPTFDELEEQAAIEQKEKERYALRDHGFIKSKQVKKDHEISYLVKLVDKKNINITVVSNDKLFLSLCEQYFKGNTGITATDKKSFKQLNIPKIGKDTYNSCLSKMKDGLPHGYKKNLRSFEQLKDVAVDSNVHDLTGSTMLIN
ncbi:hypothetical protein DGG96_10210 [Legionella qingyii]|uniref:Uncharacterized protein n=1 Tax=Legionella qingyii TaxID=2184757 RepID=A0A317TYB6_9GAMM|nr:hypothetical protein [Legionella qingyii]PWY54481.1 hypothetical protein DGG96_16730 [Legionella qingyii]PWY55660.1 hypothetical protein DGG96_10210 [Legionella qingyii]RUR21672.1 hypothetical protein ELY20_12005 [Legionella qingyii]RUR25060.1 hypothetical protein ELY16_10365 [Legionella qingyii]